MRTTHTLTTARALFISSALLIIAGLVFAFAPLSQVAAARQALAARANANPTIGKILALAPAPVRRAISANNTVTRTAVAMPASAAMMFTPYTVVLSATPPDGSVVGQGQTITYTTTITNGATADSTSANGFIRYSQNAPANTVFSNPTVVTQPGAGSAWTCILGGGGNLACQAGDGVGGAAETFAANTSVVLRVTATVNNNAPVGAIINSAGTFEYEADGTPVQEVNQNSNATNHFVTAAVDLAVTKFSQTSQPPQPDPQNSVLAGGNNVTLNTLNDVGNEGRGNISYVITFSNLGGNNAINTTIEDTVPAVSGFLRTNPPAPNGVAGLVPGPVPGQPIIPAFPGVTEIVINPTVAPTAAQFRFNCNGYGLGLTFTCTPGDNTQISPAFIVGTLPAGFQGRIGYRIQAGPRATPGSILSNQARISTNGATDINAGNNVSLPTQNLVIAKADLGITKATGNATPTAGGAAFSYTLVVTNAGPSDAVNIVVNDPLPPGVVLANANIAVVNNPAIPGYGLSCTGPANGVNGTIICTGNLPGPDINTGNISTSTITIVGQIVPNVASGVRTNTATVASDTQEASPNTLPNVASVQQNIQVNAPLSISKTGPAAVCAGDTLTYQITVNNGGPSTALNATITDPLPANTTFLSLAGTGPFAAGCSHNGGTPGTVTCAAVDIPSGLHTLNITVRLSPSAPTGTLANTATITTAGTGTIAVGTSTSNATVSRCSDLEITKDDSPDAVLAGQVINYTITVKNNGPSNIIGPNEFQVTDVLPAVANATFTPGTVIDAPGFSCNGLTAVAASFPCVYAGPLNVGASVQIKFRLTVNPNFNNGQPGAFITNSASVAILGSNATDGNANNNTSTVNTPVGPSADLSIQKTSQTLLGAVLGAQVFAGGNIAGGLGAPVTGTGEILYTLTYRNNGQGDARNVHIRDVIPGNTLNNFLADGLPTVGNGGVIVGAGPNITCSLVNILATVQLDCSPVGANAVLPAGANGTILFRVRVPENVPANTVIRNQATINSEGNATGTATPDADNGNNTSNETQNTVRTSADLGITKIGPANVIAGNTITYTLTVTNAGISNAQNVVVTDALPAGVTFVSAASNNPAFACTNANNTVTCTAATLNAPALNAPPLIPAQTGANTATITIVGRVGANVANGTVLANSATVASATDDPAAADNTSAVVNTTVATDAAVTIVKTDNPDPVVAGTNLTYNITVANNGPSDAQAVNVVDTLPAGVTFVSAVGTGVFSAANSCTHAAGVVTCNAVPGGVFPAGATANITIVVTVGSAVPPNALPQAPDDPAGLLNTATINWTDSNGVVGALVANAATDTERTTVRHESDMTIKKEAPDFIIAGTRMDYRLIVGNKGPSTVLGDATPGSIMVMDTLPLGTSLANVVPNPFVSPGGPGGFTCTYTAATRKVVCLNAAGAAGNFPPNATIEIIIKVDTASNLVDGQNLVNCAQVTLRNTNPTPEVDPFGGGHHDDANVVTEAASGNNESCDSTVVRTSADLAIGKSALPVVSDPGNNLPPVPLPVVGPNVPPGSVNAGGYIRYDIPFGNNGPSDAINVLVTDQLAGNTAYVGALAAAGFTNATTFTIQATKAASPNISLTCTVFQTAGSQSIYCRPQGNGAVPAPGPYADGTLPAGYNGTLTFFVKVNESTASGTLVSNPANITSGLCPNAVAPTFPPSACAGTGDPNTANNTSLPTQTLVISSSNLTVSKIVQSAVTAASNPNQVGPIVPGTPPNGAAVTGTAVLPGTVMTYRVTITNNGPSDVSNIRLTDVLPSGLETPPGRVLGVKYVSVNPVIPSGATFTCAAPTGVNPTNNPQGNGGSLVCTAPSLSANAPNNVAAIDITVFIDPATKANLVDVATVDATLNNFNRPISGTTTLTTPVAPTSDLALTKTHTNAAGVVGGPVTAGTVFTYTITMTNNGPSAAQMVNLVDTLPTFQQVRSISVQQSPDGNGAPNVTCVAAPAIGAPTGTGNNTTSVTCTAPELPPNKNANGTVNPAGTVVITLTVRQDEATVQPLPVNYQNCVTATSMSTDPNPANNTNICDTIPIIFLANPTGTKVATPVGGVAGGPVIAGNQLTFTITATNPGPSAALNFRITDPLPQGTVFISAAASPGASFTATPPVGTNGTVTAQWDAAGGTPGGLTLPGVTRTLTIVVRVCPDFQQIRNLTDAQMCVPNLTNTATITSDTPGTPATASSTTTVQAQSDLGITKTGPASAIANQVVTYTLTVTNAGPSNANNVLVTDVLPKGFTLVPGSIVITPTGGTLGVGSNNTPVGLVAGSPTTDAAGTQTVAINLGVIGAANQCGPVIYPTSVTITLRVRVPQKHPNITVTNTATVSSTNCLAETGTLAVQTNPLSGFPAIITPGTGMLANNRAFFDTIIGPAANDPGPGSIPGYPATAEISDQKAGSILFFPIYTSDAANPNAQNTRMSITNISSAETACVHLYMVDGASCGVVDVFLCLTPNQTVAFTAADFDPGQTGYVVAVAVDCNTGLPISFNCLIGDEFVKFSTGHQANLGAEAVAAVMFNPAGTDTTATTATLRFNGMNYNRLPRIVAVDNLQSRADQNDPLLIVNAIGGNFTRSGATIVSLFGAVYDDAETPYSFTQAASTCQFRSIINNNFPRMITRLDTAIPAGRTGWMKFWSTVDQGLFGAFINRNPNAGSNSGAFNQGHNLHKLTLTDQSSIVVPVLTPACN